MSNAADESCHKTLLASQARIQKKYASRLKITKIFRDLPKMTEAGKCRLQVSKIEKEWKNDIYLLTSTISVNTYFNFYDKLSPIMNPT